MSIFAAQEAFYTSSHTIENLFSLAVNQYINKTTITMQMLNTVVSTKELPATFAVLQNHLPSIYKSKCFNDKKFSFRKEVLATEVGHLFEHIMLEYLCFLKVKEGVLEAVFDGETHWNWKRDPFGTFHIEIEVGVEDNKIFAEALTKSMELLSLIFEESKKDTLN